LVNKVIQLSPAFFPAALLLRLVGQFPQKIDPLAAHLQQFLANCAFDGAEFARGRGDQATAWQHAAFHIVEPPKAKGAQFCRGSFGALNFSQNIFAKYRDGRVDRGQLKIFSIAEKDCDVALGDIGGVGDLADRDAIQTLQ